MEWLIVVLFNIMELRRSFGSIVVHHDHNLSLLLQFSKVLVRPGFYQLRCWKIFQSKSTETWSYSLVFWKKNHVQICIIPWKLHVQSCCIPWTKSCTGLHSSTIRSTLVFFGNHNCLRFRVYLQKLFYSLTAVCRGFPLAHAAVAVKAPQESFFQEEEQTFSLFRKKSCFWQFYFDAEDSSANQETNKKLRLSFWIQR